MRDATDYFVLDIAAVEGHEGVVRTILRHGGYIKAGDGKGYITALHCCTAEDKGPFHDNGSVVRVLLAAGADIEAKTMDVSTPLHHAASRTAVASINWQNACSVGERGADVNALNQSHTTPLQQACSVANVAGAESF